MKNMVLWVGLLVLGLMFSWSLVYAGDAFYVIPVQKCCTCKGTLVGTRWCDNGDGTVTDLTNCLVWLKSAGWGGIRMFWLNTKEGTNAHDGAAKLKDGVGGLSDLSEEGHWRLPTIVELWCLTHFDEAVRFDAMQAFTDVQSSFYWSSTTNSGAPSTAYGVSLNDGVASSTDKSSWKNVWPVRNPFR